MVREKAKGNSESSTLVFFPIFSAIPKGRFNFSERVWEEPIQRG
jgi:hypothetical protein